MNSTIEANRFCIGAYLDWLSGTRNCSPHTYAAYSGTLDKLVAHLDATPLGEASVMDLEAFVERLQAAAQPEPCKGAGGGGFGGDPPPRHHRGEEPVQVPARTGAGRL